MALSHLYWSQRFAQVNAKRMTTMLDVLKDRLLPAFSNIAAEAEAKTQEAWDAISSTLDGEDGPHLDGLAASEAAEEIGREHYFAMSDARQTLINSFAISMYHLWEQQVLSFHRRQVLDPREPQLPKLLTLNTFTARLHEIGVHVEGFASWSGIFVYRNLANTIKHAEGYSADSLKQLRPDWFVPASFRNDPLGDVFRYKPYVFEPLAGEDVYVEVRDLEAFVKLTELFWEELVAALAVVDS